MTGEQLDKAVRRLLGDPQGVKFGSWAVAGVPNMDIVGSLELAVEQLCLILPFNNLGKRATRASVTCAAPGFIARPAGIRIGNLQSGTPSAAPVYYPCNYIIGEIDVYKEKNDFLKSTQKTPTVYEKAPAAAGAPEWWHYPATAIAPGDYKIECERVQIPTGVETLHTAAFHIAEYDEIPGDTHSLMIHLAVFYVLRGLHQDEAAQAYLKTQVEPLLKLYGVRKLVDDKLSLAYARRSHA